MSLKEKIDNFKEDLDLFDDELDKYQFIIDLGKKLEGLDKDEMIEKNIVQGCTSKVWLIKEEKDGKIFFKADSNAAIVKGLVYMITNIFSNEEPKTILESNNELLKDLNLTEIITPNRQSGVQGMLKKIKAYAKEI